MSDQGYSCARSVSEKASKQARERMEIRDLIAQREQKKKARMRELVYVPKENQTPTFRQEMKERNTRACS